jgi:hypothetical protein
MVVLYHHVDAVQTKMAKITFRFLETLIIAEYMVLNAGIFVNRATRIELSQCSPLTMFCLSVLVLSTTVVLLKVSRFSFFSY